MSVLGLSGDERVGLGQNWVYIKWLISQGTDLSALVSDFGIITNSTESWPDRVAALHHAIDLLAAAISSFPKLDLVALKAQIVDLDACEAELVAARFDGHLIKALLEMWPQIWAVIQTLLPLFGFVV